MKKIFAFALAFWVYAITIYSQSLFESAVDQSSTADESALAYQLNGSAKGSAFIGKSIENDEFESKTNYSELNLQFKITKQEFGDAFADIRFRSGTLFNQRFDEIVLRECYINSYIGNLNFRIGQQIVVWGKADGFNPTNNITPLNMLARSSDEDDRRLSNFLIRSFYNLQHFRFEAIWVPSYASSKLPTEIAVFPDNIIFAETEFPGNKIKDSNFALKFHYNFPQIDGTFSYFSGYLPSPGINLKTVSANSVTINPKPYQTEVFGMDFSTTLVGFGLRGEFAYKKTEEEYKIYSYIPNPELNLVLGLDKDITNSFSLIVQYIGKRVQNFSPLNQPLYPIEIPAYTVELQNRIISGQKDEYSHSFSFRPSLSLLYETLTIEALGFYNFTTEEIFIRPKITYDYSDGFQFIAGFDYYQGKKETLYDLIDNHLSSIFVEMMIYF